MLTCFQKLTSAHEPGVPGLSPSPSITSPNPDGTWSETVLHSFRDTDGGNPDVGRFADARGNLYGTTPYGGSESYGTVFRLSRRANNT